ncbi:S8 family serine peptidase [Dyella jiangningensis]|uniref:Protease n=1 Tax=Dyella jiangningensis TaxID=1379159 RepID=A0A328P4Y1_9GAMM|nr:S8 family serine peptidase [Dyella jiangningensis]RAO77099.1 protease [Dyella jiangningensis]
MSYVCLIRRSALVAALSMSISVAFAANTTAPVAKTTINVTSVNATHDRFIVTYRSGTTERANHAAVVQNVAAALTRAGVKLAATRTQSTPVTYQRKLGTGAELVRTSRKLSQQEANALMQQLAADPAVLSVQPDVMMHKTAVTPVVPNDPKYATYQWHMRAGDGTMETIGRDTTSFANRGGANVANAWNLADGTGITVAVLDTGITQHSDLDMSLAASGYDFISDAFVSGRADNSRVPGGWDLGDWTTDPVYTDPTTGCVDASQAEDSSWHGTHVAGTIAELTNNNLGFAGVANKARVLPVRVLGHCGGYTSDIADAITWASGGHVDGVPDNTTPVQVVSMSLGGEGSCTADDATGSAIAGAISRGVTVVVAAGNSNSDSAYFSPASCPGVITVASNGITGKRAFYSNYGTGITVSAPGGGGYANDASSGTIVDAGFVWSTINTGTHAPVAEGYGGMAGTSQATPHVSGVVALMASARKTLGLAPLTPAQVRSVLIGTARAFPSKPDQTIGAGIVDAYAAVVKASNPATTDPTAVQLINGTPVTGLTGSASDTLLYALDVPAGARSLNLRTLGGTGDVSLFVKVGTAPALDGSDATYKSVKPGNSESVVISTPTAGTYYIRVVGVADFNKVTLLGSFIAP